jgi:hypothetical protein
MSPGAADALHAFLDELIVEGVRLTTPLEAVSAHGT